MMVEKEIKEEIKQEDDTTEEVSFGKSRFAKEKSLQAD